ncbi:hypothetical protein Patl1_20346 [Pistacia atlantica]|uniref:Uncharacterized protein n=1 Tax=Pistacia atlantica TaxID=434234 RepID=A0ACC1BMR5_9ROSI|nr:hypothetical protein Patl1_20346 [Pistacia atlantica]
MITLSLPAPAKFPPPSLKHSKPSGQNLQLSSPPLIKQPHNLEPLNSRLIHHLNEGHLQKAISTLDLMTEHNIHPDRFTYSLLLKSCIRSRAFHLGRHVHSHLMTHSKPEPNSVILNSLISLYSKCGDLNEASMIFETMGEKRDLVSWSSMISCFANNGKQFEALLMFTLSGVVSACSELEVLSLGQQLHSWIIRTGLALDVCVGCSLVDMYAKCTADGSMDYSRKVFDRMLEHNVMSWTAVITGYVQSGGCDKEAIKLFCDMIQGGHVVPNHFTFASVLKACGNLLNSGLGEQVYTHAVKRGLALDNCVGNSLISMYARSGRMDDARKAFESLFEKNLVSYNTMVDAVSKFMLG